MARLPLRKLSAKSELEPGEFHHEIRFNFSLPSGSIKNRIGIFPFLRAASSLSNKIMRDPRTKNVLGFAMIGVLAAVVFSMAQNPGDKVTLAKHVLLIDTDGKALLTPGKNNIKLISASGDNVTVELLYGLNPSILPKSFFVEFGGTLESKDDRNLRKAAYPVTVSRAPKITPWTGYVHQEPQPGHAPIGPTGFTPELVTQLNKIVAEQNQLPHVDAAANFGGLWKSIPLSQTLAEYLASGKPVTEEQKWKFSLRQQFDQYGIRINEERRSDLSCGPVAFHDALELIWSQKEGKPVHLSLSFLRWAHDQVMKEQQKNLAEYSTATDSNIMIQAILRYGICRRELMDNSQRIPSAAAIADAATRKQLVTRIVTLAQRPDPKKLDISITPVEELVISELQKGRPILVTGGALMPSKKYYNWAILEQRPNSFANRPTQINEGQFEWPNTTNGVAPHVHLLTGYFLAGTNGSDGCQLIQSIPNELKRNSKGGLNNYQYIWEFREGIGINLGDRGYVFTTNNTINELKNNMFSLALE